MGYSVTNMVLPPLAKSPGASVTTVAAGQEKQTDHHHDSSTPLLPAIVDTRSGGQHVYRRLALAGTGEKPDRARISVWCSERGVFDFCLGMWLWHWANKNVEGGGGGVGILGFPAREFLCRNRVEQKVCFGSGTRYRWRSEMHPEDCRKYFHKNRNSVAWPHDPRLKTCSSNPSP